MKKFFIATIAALSLVGCASMKQPSEAEIHTKQLGQDLEQLSLQRKAGQIGHVAYFESAYKKTLEHNMALFVNRYRLYVAEMTPIARKFEAGVISKDQFDDVERKMRAEMLNDVERDRQALVSAQNAEKSQRQAQALQSMAITQQLMNANRPPPMQIQPQINCRSRSVGGTVYTDCN